MNNEYLVFRVFFIKTAQSYNKFRIYARIFAKFFSKTLFFSVFDALRTIFLDFCVPKQREAPESASLFHNFLSHIRSNGYFLLAS